MLLGRKTFLIPLLICFIYAWNLSQLFLRTRFISTSRCRACLSSTVHLSHRIPFLHRPESFYLFVPLWRSTVLNLASTSYFFSSTDRTHSFFTNPFGAFRCWIISRPQTTFAASSTTAAGTVISRIAQNSCVQFYINEHSNSMICSCRIKRQ